MKNREEKVGESCAEASGVLWEQDDAYTYSVNTYTYLSVGVLHPCAAPWHISLYNQKIQSHRDFESPQLLWLQAGEYIKLM